MPIVCLIVFQFSNAIAAAAAAAACNANTNMHLRLQQFHSYGARADRHQTHQTIFNSNFRYETTKRNKMCCSTTKGNIKDFPCVFINYYARTQITLNNM